MLSARQVVHDGLGESRDPARADARAREVQLQDPENDRRPRTEDFLEKVKELLGGGLFPPSQRKQFGRNSF